MIKHSETRSLKYSSDQMFDLVADIESYPTFIPWCRAVSITSRIKHDDGKDEVVADMNVSFKVFKETFSSRVVLSPFSKNITVEYITGPFKFLRNTWVFKDSDNGCSINFSVEFEFKSRIIQGLAGVVFQEAMRRIVQAFELRAATIYEL